MKEERNLKAYNVLMKRIHGLSSSLIFNILAQFDLLEESGHQQ